MALDKAWEAERKQAQELVEKTVELLRAKGLKASGRTMATENRKYRRLPGIGALI